ncbi:MAG: hypothetical protein ABI668_05090 [Sphingorhabdus sp.]
MNTVLKAISIMAIGATPVNAQATDWWWVSGTPGADNIYFVDADSVVKNGNKVTFVNASFRRSGENKTELLTMYCDQTVGSEEQSAMRDFACSSKDERMANALNLGGAEPDQLAMAIFAMPKS